jgi:hypothetical protein
MNMKLISPVEILQLDVLETRNGVDVDGFYVQLVENGGLVDVSREGLVVEHEVR